MLQAVAVLVSHALELCVDREEFLFHILVGDRWGAEYARESMQGAHQRGGGDSEGIS